MQHADISAKDFRINVVQHKSSDLLVALSPDLPGLMVPGRSVNEIEERLPAAMQELLEARGFKVVRIETTPENDHLPEAFAKPGFKANAQLMAA